MKFSTAVLASLFSAASAHYVFSSLIVNDQVTPEWVNVRMTDNHWTTGPVTDVNSPNLRCYTSETKATATTINVAAGSTIGFTSTPAISHPGVWNTYMAKVPAGQTAATWDGSGAVWFKVHQISAVTDGGQTITFPSEGLSKVTFNLPKSLPSGEYLIRGEHIALHSASSAGGAQIYIACGQINITGGGSGKPGPLVAIPGVYNGKEPGILVNIYWPIPTNYTQPGPAVWSG